jgi:hypothetical protein
MRPLKKTNGVKPKFVGIRFDASLVNTIDKECKVRKITRTEWIHEACRMKLDFEKSVTVLEEKNK